MPVKEKEIQNSIAEYLKYKHIFHYRNNSGAMIRVYKGKESLTRYGTLGSPDIICVINGLYVGLEVKGEKGKQSDNQKLFQESLEKAGGLYFIVRSIEDVEKILNETIILQTKSR